MKELISYSAIAILLILSGCATNPYTEFYTDNTGGIDVRDVDSIELPDHAPIINPGTNIEADNIRMREEGYKLLGFSSFNAGSINRKDLASHAKKVNAAVVLTYSQYTNTVSGSMPLTRPDTQTSTTHMSGTGQTMGTLSTPGGSAYNYNEGTSVSGTSTTTTYGTRTTYVPYTINRFDHFASFWIKSKNIVFGVFLRDLTTEERIRIGSNRGTMIDIVIKNSPAFYNDIFRGDILLKIGDVEIYGRDTFNQAITQYAGMEIPVVLIRGDKEITKEIQFASFD